MKMNENTVQVQSRFNLQYPKQRDYVHEMLKRQLGDYLLGKIFDNKRDIICISQIAVEDFPEFDYEDTMTRKLTVTVDYAHNYPVIVHSGFQYQGNFVKPIGELSLFERIKFLFTGEYPM